MWVTYTFLLTYIIILGARAARSSRDPAPCTAASRPGTWPLALPSSRLPPVLVLVLVLAPVPAPHTHHAARLSHAQHALPSPGVRRLNRAMQMLLLLISNLLGLLGGLL